MHSILIALAFLSTTAFGALYSVTGDVRFEGQGNPDFMRINGTGGHVTGAANDDSGKVQGEFKVKLADFSTGIELRDRHMREKYLETAKYPEASLTLKPWTKTADWSMFEADLTLKGVTKPVKGLAKYKDGKLKADFKVDMSDFPIGIPSWLGVTMVNSVMVIVDAEAK